MATRSSSPRRSAPRRPSWPPSLSATAFSSCSLRCTRVAPPNSLGTSHPSSAWTAILQRSRVTGSPSRTTLLLVARRYARLAQLCAPTRRSRSSRPRRRTRPQKPRPPTPFLVSAPRPCRPRRRAFPSSSRSCGTCPSWISSARSRPSRTRSSATTRCPSRSGTSGARPCASSAASSCRRPLRRVAPKTPRQGSQRWSTS
mmetsp:Transcript_7650/g.16812  ORF Transcript_7650/g.16812 Transcript_7650/m.16812 type:complete len:200 (+) Transcript_7650:459-1058(+)